MTKEQYQAALGSGRLRPETPPAETTRTHEPEAHRPAYSLEDFLPLLLEITRPKQHLTAAPTFTPRNLLESIQLYDTGGVRRLYLYVNGTWRYSTLT
jgi:hypothetical protein